MRIISGKFKGKKLFSPTSEDIRPTLDKTKQAFFTKHQFDIDGCAFLDLFGGSGAIGIEAVSRGAKRVVIVDNHDASIDLIKKNNALIENGACVLKTDYKKYLRETEEKFDFIFIDPPYLHKRAYEFALQIIKEKKLLSENGIAVCEHDISMKFSYDGYEVISQKKYGLSYITYLKILD